MKRSIRKLVAMVLLVAQLVSLLPMSVLAETVNMPSAQPAVMEAGEPTGEKPIDGEPAGEEPTDGEPVGEEPADSEPADEEPADGEPTGEDPADSDPAGEKSADEDPADGEPADGEPVDGEDPADSEPVGEKPTDGEPADEERDPVYAAVEKGDTVYTTKHLDTALGTVTKDGYLYITEIYERGSRFVLKVIFDANDDDCEGSTAETGFVLADSFKRYTEAEDNAISADLRRDALTVRSKNGFAVPLIGFDYAESEEPVVPEEGIEEPAGEEPEDGEEEPVVPPLMLTGPLSTPAGEEPNGGNEEITPEQITEMIVAEYYPNGVYRNPELPNGQIALGLTGGPASGQKVLAGDSFNYTISYGFNAAPNWTKGWDPIAKLFDSYDNISLSLTLPPELVLSTSENYRFTTETLTDGSHKYTFTNVPTSVSSSANSSSFSVTIQVAGNGTENATVPVHIDSDALEFSASYTLLNKAYPAGSEGRTLETFTETKTAGGQTIERYSPDKWLINKSTVGTPALDRSKHTATVTYKIELGLADMTDPNVMLTNDTQYARFGRNVFDTAKMTDALSTLISGGPCDGQPLSLVETNPIAVRKDSTDATPVYLSTADLASGIDLTAGDLALNKNVSVDSDIDPAHTADTPVASYTVYYVTAIYDLSDDIMDQFDAADTKLKFNNTSTLNYTLHNMQPDGGSSGAVHTADMPVIDPAHFQIKKQLKDYAGTVAAYSNQYGPIAFTLTAKHAVGEANVDFKVYQLQNGVYVPLTETAQDSYTVYMNQIYYLQAGMRYSVVESLNDEQTPYMSEISSEEQLATHNFLAVEKQGYEPFFVNEEQLGQIVIDKRDVDTNFVLQGAKFTLYKADGVTPYMNTVEESTVTTGTDGKASFTKIPFGSYVLKETEPPTGYAIDPSTGDTFRIVIGSGDLHTVEVLSKNKKTMATVTLTKKGGTFETDPSAVSGNNAPWNENHFTLERSLDGTTWETLTKDIYNDDISGKVNAQGTIAAAVSAFAQDGSVYTYRFKENIPTGWYAPDDISATVTYSAAVELAENGVATDKNVEIVNRRKVQVTVYKTHYDATAAGGAMTPVTTKAVDVTLYKSYGNTSGAVMTSVATKSAMGVDDTAAKFTDLPCYDATGRIYYYVCEDDIPGYKLDVYAKQSAGASSATKVSPITGSDGKKYYPVSVIGVENTVNFYNVEQKVPSIIYKKNYYTGSTAFIENCYVTVTDVTDADHPVIAKDIVTGAELNNVLIPDANGLKAFLAPGHKYQIVETDWDEEHFTPKNATAASPLVLDLTGVVVDYAHRNNLEVKTATVKNAPDVRVKITKRDKSTATATVVTKTAEFTAYTYDDATGKYVKYLDEDGNAIVIKGDGTYTGVKARFKANTTYYFAETKVPEGYLDPSVFTSQYTGSSWKIGTTDTGETYNFYVKKIVDSTSTSAADNYASLTIDNIPNKGSIKVVKEVDGSVTSIPDFEVLIKDAAGNTVGSGTTDTNGEVTIEGLPVYDASGNKIVYTVEEGTLPSATYYKVFDGQTAELTIGTVTTTAKAGSPTDPADPTKTYLHISNETYTELSATKWYRHTWEYQYTEKSYPMTGVTFGLFEHDTVNHKWIKVEGSDIVTGSDGKIDYSDLRRDTDYAVVELAGPDPFMFPYSEDGVTEKQYAGNLTEISEADFNKYNVAVKNAYSTDVEIGDLYNQDRWVQFDIDKYIDALPLNDDPAEGPLHGHKDHIDKNEHDDIPADKLYDDAVFRMYRYVVPEGTASVVFDPDTWELMGTYTSGSAYYMGGGRAAGKFITGVDQKAAENVVYMLVETNAGVSAGTINPNFKYTFYQHKSASYTVSGTGSYTPRARKYDFGYNWDEVLNSRVEGSGDGIMVAALRLAKWQDSFDDDGKAKEDYKPLGNVTFDMILDATGQKLETLTTGLNPESEGSQDASRAWAQSAPYLLKKIVDGDDVTFKLKALATEEDADAEDDADNGVIVTPEILQQTAAYTVYGLPITLKETDVPKGYGKGVGEYHCYLAFVETEASVTKVYNDSYFVTDSAANAAPLATDQRGIAWKVTASDGSYPFSTIERIGGGTFRIVDYPTQNTLVRIEKYGYTPTTDTVGKTADDLDDMTLTGKTSLQGVKLTLQHLDESVTPAKWEWWNPNTAEPASSAVYFYTRSDGSFVVSKGLPAGTYRVLEASSQDASLAAYEFIYSNSNVGGRTFKVGEHYKVVTMYNPKKVGLTITKKDTEGKLIKGLTFTLTPTSGSAGTGLSKTTDANGVATFTNITSGTYKLSESADNTALAATLLSKYIASLNNADLNALAGNGALIGYTRGMSTATNEDGLTEVVITKIGLNDANFSFEVVDPHLITPKVRKVDETPNADGSKKGLQGATFNITRKEFSKWSGENVITTNGTWTAIKTGAVTSDDGWYTLGSNYRPGVYRFEETAAPGGYDIIKDVNGNTVYFYLVLTGGVPVTVKKGTGGLPETATIPDGSGGTMTIQTLFIDPAAGAEMIIPNRKQVTVSAKKDIEPGLADKSTLKWTVTLDLYDAPSGGNKVGSASLTQADTDYVTFKKGTADAELSVGKTYYLQESVTSTPASDYKLIGVKVGTADATLTGSRYEVKVNGKDEVKIDVTNRYMRGGVTFEKLDQKKLEQEDLRTLLKGASFAVEWPDGTPVAGATVKPVYDSNNEETGRYYADIPMQKKDGSYPADNEEITVIIRETAAPEHYVLQDGKTLTVTLTPENNILDWTDDDDPGHYITNNEGWTLKILKLNNIPGSDDPQPVKDHTVAFEVYQRNADGKYARYEGAKQTDDNGYVSWTLMPGETYAFYESNWDPNVFTGIHSAELHVAGGTDVPVTMTEIERTDGSKIKAFVIGAVNSDLEYWAYNIPALRVKFIKEDVGGYPVGIIPNTHFSVYEVDSLPTSRSGYLEAIAGFGSKTPVFEGTTGSAAGETEGYTTFKIWSKYDPTKNYIAVEDNVGTKTSGATYNTLNKADKRVVWYVGIAAGENTDPNYVLEKTFKNVYGDAKVELEKSVVDHDAQDDLNVHTAADTENASVGKTIDSLLKGSRKVVFEVKPTVTTNNSALSTFTVSDTGIKFYYKNSAGAKTEAADGSYTITGITIGQVLTHDVSNFIGDAGTGTVSALVTWNKADGTSVTSTATGLSNGPVDLNAPAGTQSFSVSYFSSGVQTATDGMYSLGWNFTVDPIVVYATLNQQTDGSVSAPVTPITSLTNFANTELTYTRWGGDGTTATRPERKTASAQDSINVEPIEYPVPSVTKSTTVETVIPGDTVSYTITVKNNSTTENFIDPVIVDTMPLGMTLVGTPVVSNGSAGETMKLVSTQRMIGSTVTAAAETETAFALNISGTLQPQSTFTVTFQGVVSENAVIYGNKLMNFVFLSSSATSYHTADNPKGYSFRNADGSLPYTLPVEAPRNLPAEDGTQNTCVKRVEDLKNALGDYYTDKYIFIKNYVNISLNTSDTMTLSKSIRGDQDPAFSAQDGFLATATRNNSTPAALFEDGYVEYILGCVNGTNLEKIGIAIGDAISKIGDGRATKWDTEFDYIESVQFGGKSMTVGTGEGHYRLYVYRGAVAGADAAVRAACADNTDWYGENAKAWSLNGVPSGWEEITTESCYDPDITAFVLVFGLDNVLEEGQSIHIKYHTRVEDIPTEEEWEGKGFQNANNVAHLNFVESFLGDMPSNPVACVLMDKTVQVAGDLWIDEEQNGVQKQSTAADYHDADYFLQWDIIETLANNFNVEIDDMRTSYITPSGAPDPESVWDGVGQSLVHFGFKDIGAASQQFSNLYIDEDLNTAALKTTDPYNYIINAGIPSSLTNVIKLTQKGEKYYTSDWTGSCILDSNFIENGNAYTFRTKRFFVSYENGNDHTKDIGVILNRNLDIVKVADDDNAFTIEGATFRVYGPYAEGGATAVSGSPLKFRADTDTEGNIVSYTYDPSGSVTDLVTDDKGNIHIKSLNWFKEYIIKETVAAPGFKLEGATGTGDRANADITALESEGQAWVLHLPKYEAMTPDNTLTVENVRDVSAVLGADKDLVVLHSTKRTLTEGEFEFELYKVASDGTETFVEKKANGADGHVDFTAQTYTAAGTYIYKIKEVVPADKDKKPGVTYSTEPAKAVVEVTWDADAKKFVTEVNYYDIDGNLIKDSSDNPADTLVITNEYKPGPVELQIPAKKKVTYTVAPKPGTEFTFVLAAVTEGAPMPAAGGESVTVADLETGLFGKLIFTDAGEYEYTVTEVEPAEKDKVPGYVYDTTPRRVTVTVTENLTTAKLEVSWTVDGETEESVLITNEYKVEPATAELPVKKVITGQTPPADKDFTFTLTGEKTETPMPAAGGESVTVTGATEGKFGVITYTLPGTYRYTATEVDQSTDPAYKGYAFSKSSFTYVVTVTENPDTAKLEASWTVNGKSVTPEFENTYIPEKTAAELFTAKEIQGMTPPVDKQFTMQLAAVGGAPMPANYQDAVITGANTASFGKIEFTAAGTYEYTVKEVDKSTDPAYKGYSFDTDMHTVKITVTDNGGSLAVTDVKVDGEAVDLTKTVITVTITNRYDTEPTEIDLPVGKLVTGHARVTLKEFEFTITADEDNEPKVMPKETAITIKDTGDGTVGKGSFEFAEGAFTDAGTYKYTIKETIRDDKGYVYDTKQYAVTVTVEDDAGQLRASFVSNPALTDGVMLFTNKYEPEAATLILPVEKQLTGKATPTDKPFVFTITGEKDDTPMPMEDGKTVNTVTITGAGKGAFAPITYDKAGEYKYTVVETKAKSIDYTGYTFDKTTYTVVVTVSVDEANGKLVAAYDVVDADECIFKNDYTPSTDDVVFPVKKVVTGNETPGDAEFTFELTPGSTMTDAPMPSDSVDGKAYVTVKGSAEGKFGTITFNTAGIYTYDVKEIIPDPPVRGYVYDQQTHTYTVTVIDKGGELEATWHVDNDEKLLKPTFTNVYAPTALVIPVEKQLTGNPTPSVKPFVFTITGEKDDTPMPAAGGETVTIMGANKSAFGAIEYEKAGEYRYTVVEKKAENVDYTGYEFDETVYTVVVTVTDKGDGQLLVSYDVVDTDECVFVNKYIPNPDSIVIPVKKTVDGPVPEGCDKTFTFDLAAVTKDAPLPAAGTAVQVPAGQIVSFGAIELTAAGTYQYTVTERDQSTEPDFAGYTFDLTPRNITVTVVDNEGELTATWTSDGEEVESVDFVNPYMPIPVPAVIKAFKILKNATLRPDQFEFELSDETGAVIEVARNTADGNIVFKERWYTKAGVYTYFIKERVGGQTDIIYDTATRTVTVTVTDVNGHLTAEVTEISKLIFINRDEPWIPPTGYGENRDGLLCAIGAAALVALICALPKKRKRKEEE